MNKIIILFLSSISCFGGTIFPGGGGSSGNATNVFLAPYDTTITIRTNATGNWSAQANTNQLTLTNSVPWVRVFPDGTAYGQSGKLNTAGTTTCGIQEALNALFYTNALGPISGGGKIIFERGIYAFSGQIVIDNSYPLDLVWEGSGKMGTVLKYTGTTNAIIDKGHANLPPPRLQITMRDIGFAYLFDTNKAYLMLLRDVNECRFERCLWTTWQSISNSPYSTLNYINSVPLTGVGTVGARIGQGADNKHVYENCTFYGLASGLWDEGDHIIINGCMLANCGFTSAGAGAYTNVYIAASGALETNLLALGGAIILTTGGFNDVWIKNSHFHFCNSALVISGATGARFTDCIWEGTQYGTLADSDATYSIVYQDFTSTGLATLGDYIFNPTTGAIGAASTSATHWTYDSAGIGSMLNVSVGVSSKLNLSSSGALTVNNLNVTSTANVTSMTVTQVVNSISLFSGPTNNYDMAGGLQHYVTFTPCAITGFVGTGSSPAQQKNSQLVISNAASTNITFTSTLVTTPDGLRTYTVTNGTVRRFGIGTSTNTANGMIAYTNMNPVNTYY